MQNSVEHNLDRRRHAASAAYGATTPRRMVMRHGGGGERSNVMRSGAFGRRSRTKAQASRPWIPVALSLLSPFVRLRASPDDCRSPVWNTGCSCGNECCRPYRSKTAHHAQRRQHGSATKRSAAAACRKVRRLPALWRGKAATCPQFLGLLTTSPIRQQGVFHAHH